MRFFASEIPALKPEQARFHVVPVPYEKTVSYGHGTALGPGAIIEASSQLERFDGLSDPGAEGISPGLQLTVRAILKRSLI